MMRDPRKNIIQLCLIAGGCAASIFFWSFAAGNAAGLNGLPVEPEPELGDIQNFSRFDHRSAEHGRMPCLLCHVRNDNSARLRMPSNINHQPCAACHQAQFKDPASGICTICHTSGADGGPIKSMPGLQNFTSKFDHARHVRQTNCATCHSTNRAGRGFSVPSGANAHVTCFRCHTAESQIASCDTCHVGGRPLRNTDAAKAYSINFSHSAHVRGAGLNCASCHTVLAGTAKGRQVTEPAAAEHFPLAGTTSCSSCHNNKRAFGPPNFNDCRRCHTGKTFRFGS
jgi:c(7)-type cytochrome triheme protein